ncbi:hypothetical protein G7Y79_00051g086790 [Physcia stellaris]|nr:hypothetical protein G7Y79_00051g086790 [Physcia stellaris]
MDKKKKPALPPEIIRTIYGFIQDLGTLYTCALISRSWSDVATEMIWGSKEKAKHRATALLAIRDVEGSQPYANSIVSLDFESLDSDHRPINVKYPKLQEVSLVLSTQPGTMWGAGEECYLQYLQPALRSIVFYSSTSFHGLQSEYMSELNKRVSPSRYLLHEIQHRCSNLRNISFQLPNDSKAMERFLDASTGLEQVILTPNCVYCRPWTDETEDKDYTGIFIALSKLPRLNHLQWPTIIDASRVQAVQAQTTRPFMSLLQLRSRIEPGAFDPLLSILRGLNVLDTLVLQRGLDDYDKSDDDYNDTEILSPIAQCHSLEVLKLVLSRDTEIDGPLFMQIPLNCSKLKVLTMYSNYGLRINLSAAEMNTFATSLPQLRELHLMVGLQFDASDLRSFARYCSGLEECTVNYMDLLSLTTEEPPLFPKLRLLNLCPDFNRWTKVKKSAAPHYIEIIKYHMPRLEDFDWGSDQYPERTISRGLKKWTESKKRSI